MTTDKRMKLTHLIKKLTDESVEQLLETACKLFAANTIAQRPDCPYCQSSSIVKNGHKCGKQEYRCKECRKTFVSTTNTLMSNSHQSSETWEELIQDTISGESISYSAKRLSISHDCAFHMRHKFLMSLEDVQTEYTVKLGGVSELDETFVLDSYKGKKLPENVNRKPRKHGESAQKAGLSKEYVCICTGIERKGAAMALTVNRAKPSSQELQDVFSEHVSCDTLALCDGLRGYATLEKATGCSVKNVLTEQNHSFFNLNTVNSFHSFIKRRYAFYRGVATKYLNRYNALFGFAFRQIDGAFTRLKSLLLNVSIVDRFYSIRNTVSSGLLAL